MNIVKRNVFCGNAAKCVGVCAAVKKRRFKKRYIILAAVLLLLVFTAFFPSIVVSAEGTDRQEELDQNIEQILGGLDLSGLQQYLDENSDSYLFNFGDNAKQIITYLISGNAGTDYGSYINEILSVIFSDVISLLPAFAEVVAIALLCAVFSCAEGNILGKSTSRVVKLACYSLIVVIISSALAGVAEECISCVAALQKQMEIITPILVTLTVLTGGTGSAAIYQPSAVFLSGGAVQMVSGFVFPAAIAAAVLGFMSKINPQISFSGMAALLKSLIKWVLGITATVFSVFLTVQSSATSLFDGVLFKATKYIIGNSVPIVGGFLSGGFDLLTAAGLLVKNSVGLCGLIMLILQVASPLILLIAFSLLLKVAGAVVQAAGENDMYSLFSDLSSDVGCFTAGLLTVTFMYWLIIMLIINSANSFI